ncbi:MAG: sigma-70 family RNA polymerase sigma factor [Planctomycetes bacterium]|nr:sigma-70 family RNA polymerase sigma factor [Planctomycetota bacterium]MCB9919501.1 sigma-70 family RNA polymerase sigma factor [Planctomycetota bacterium]
MTDRQRQTSAPLTLQLLQRIRAGDTGAREELFRSAVPPLLTYVRIRLGTRLAANVEPIDVVQETLAAALPKIDEFEPQGRGAFVAWLCRIAERQIHDLHDHFSAKKRDANRVVSNWSDIATRLCAAGTNPLSAAARNDERDRLEAALLELEGDERDVILSVYFEGRSLRECAELEGIALTSLHRMLGRAIAKLGIALAAPDKNANHGDAT